MTISVQAIRFHQKQEDVTLYATVLPAGQILAHCRVDCFREDTPWGYQRPLTRAEMRLAPCSGTASMAIRLPGREARGSCEHWSNICERSSSVSDYRASRKPQS